MGLQDSQQQWWNSFLQSILQLWGVIGQSRICKSVKHQRRSSSAKVCGVPLDDWANGGYADGIFTCGELVLVLWEAGPMRSNGYGI